MLILSLSDASNARVVATFQCNTLHTTSLSVLFLRTTRVSLLSPFLDEHDYDDEDYGLPCLTHAVTKIKNVVS